GSTVFDRPGDSQSVGTGGKIFPRGFLCQPKNCSPDRHDHLRIEQFLSLLFVAAYGGGLGALGGFVGGRLVGTE
ncbi:MAG: hypothetical protein ABEJ47_02430, partial [Halorhabdus sp.]